MAKSRTLNEIRQSKEYQIAKANADLQQEVALQGGDFIKPTNKPAKSTGEIMLEDQIKKVKDNRTHPCSESTAEAIAKHQLQYKNPFEHAEVDNLVDKIADKLSSNIFDVIFQAVNDEMSNYYTFQDTNYLTEAGLELFEDEWFEFYHENHGRIMHKLLQNLK
jgi:hypothetical protein